MNDEPWDKKLVPLALLAKNSQGKHLPGAEVRVTPARGVFFEERTPIPEGWFTLPEGEARLRALVPPDEYRVEFTHRHGTDVRAIQVPVSSVQIIELGDKLPFYIRVGTWDEVIVKEHAYPRLKIQPGDSVMDVGAHVGVFARRALADGASNVWCYEPEWGNAELLRVNLIQTNTFAYRSQVFECAMVSDDAESIQLWVEAAGDGKPGRTALHSIKRQHGTRVPRRVLAVRWEDELRKHQPDVLKVDVEGAEMDYDWTALASDREGGSVQRLAVELEWGRKEYKARVPVITQQIKDCGFELVHQTKGWSINQVWERVQH